MQTSAAGTFQPTESLFAVYREPFFNTIGQKRKDSNRAFHVRFSPDSGGRADIPDNQLGAINRHLLARRPVVVERCVRLA